VIDGQTVITGSHNWSVAANNGNDETVLVIQNKTVADHFEREFNRVYGNAQLGLPDVVKKKIEAQQKQCTTSTISPTPSPTNLSTPGLTENDTIQKVNLNTASQQELEALPGVGPKLATQIIQARQQKPFTSLADLDKVPGVGPSLLEKLRDRVTW